jgi:putative flippase GtrA
MTALTAQILKFATVGVAATLAHIAVGVGLNTAAHASPLTANLVAFVCATFVSCVGNWLWTFDRRTPLAKAAPRFLALALFCLGLNQTIVFLMTEVARLPYVAALVPIVTLVPALSFWLSRSRVFVDVGDYS